MLDKVKLSLRIKTNKLDIDITDLIEEAKGDLKRVGIPEQIINKDDPLISRAIKLYCKANFGLENKDAEKYQKAYEMVRDELSLCGDYNVE